MLGKNKAFFSLRGKILPNRPKGKNKTLDGLPIQVRVFVGLEELIFRILLIYLSMALDRK